VAVTVGSIGAEYFPWNSDEEVVDHMLKPSGFTLKQLLEDSPHGVMFGKRSYEPEKKFRTPIESRAARASRPETPQS